MGEIFHKKISIDSMSAIFSIAAVSVFILLNLTVGFSWPAYLFAMILSFGIAVRHPQAGILAIIVLTMIFERFFTLQTFFIGKVEYKIYPLDIIMVGTALGTIIEILKGKARLIWKRADKILLGFFVLNFLYFAAAVSFQKSDAALAFSTLKNYVFYAGLYFLAALIFRTREDLFRAFRFLVGTAAIISIFILIGILRGEGLWSEYTPLSTSGVRILAFTHGLYLTLALITLFFVRVIGRRNENVWEKGLIFIWTIGIIGTMMRHLWVALAAVLAAGYFLLDRRARTKARDILALTMFAFLVSASVVIFFSGLFPQAKISGDILKVSGVVYERAQSIQSPGTDESYSWRTLVWRGAYESYKHSPILGIGTGQRVYVETADYREFVEIRNIHNSFLSVLIQLGIGGLLLFCGFVFQLMRELWKLCENTILRIFALPILGIIGLFIIALNFQPYLETNLLSIMFWLSLGLGRGLLTHNLEK